MKDPRRTDTPKGSISFDFTRIQTGTESDA
jgi:hypothetical protein